MSSTDPTTGRPFGDHGTGSDAIEFALEHIDDFGDAIEFLRSWFEGGAKEDGWDDFYDWLKETGR